MSWREDLSSLTSVELRRRIGSTRQLARADIFEFEDGPARGSRLVRLSSAGGFDAEILPDRGMDLAAVSWNGIPLSWSSSLGSVAPGLLGGSAEAWSFGFGGGMLTTCGLDQFGRATEDDGESLPMHGRAHTQVASEVHVWSDPLGPSGELGFSGTTRQARALGENLRLDRRITTTSGGNTLVVEDVVTNESSRRCPHLILYHVNIGWPFVDESSVLQIGAVGPEGPLDPLGPPVPRDLDASAGLDEWWRMSTPLEEATEQVFRHPLPPRTTIEARVASPTAGAVLTLRFDSGDLPELYQWKQLEAGAYVLGIEPANAQAINGRSEARHNGTLPVLDPLESRTHRIEIGVEPLD